MSCGDSPASVCEAQVTALNLPPYYYQHQLNSRLSIHLAYHGTKTSGDLAKKVYNMLVKGVTPFRCHSLYML